MHLAERADTQRDALLARIAADGDTTDVASEHTTPRAGAPSVSGSFHCIVQHSAAGYGGDGTFRRGLETRAVDAATAVKVRAAGGVALENWAFADCLAEIEMYPPGDDGLVPLAQGGFAALTVDGLAVYTPTPAGQMFAALADTWTGSPDDLAELVRRVDRLPTRTR